MKLTILTPEGTAFEGDVERVSLPGTEGAFTVLRRHAPLIASLEAGRVAWMLPGGMAGEIPVGGGFVKVENDIITVCAETTRP